MGIEVNEKHSGAIMLTQTKYIKDLLAKSNMEGANGVDTLMFNQCKLGTNVIFDPTRYK